MWRDGCSAMLRINKHHICAKYVTPHNVIITHYVTHYALVYIRIFMVTYVNGSYESLTCNVLRTLFSLSLFCRPSRCRPTYMASSKGGTVTLSRSLSLSLSVCIYVYVRIYLVRVIHRVHIVRTMRCDCSFLIQLRNMLAMICLSQD